MNEVVEHHGYLADTVRLDGYRAAFQRVIRPGGTVLDLGSGTGILGFLALESGAGRVYSVDRGSILQIGRMVAQYSDLAALSFIQGHSRSITLPERVDLAVCDQMGPLGIDAGLLQAFSDARQRHLRPGGILVPSRVDIEFAPVGAVELRETLDLWCRRPAGIDYSPAHVWAVNQQYAQFVTREHVLGSVCAGPSFETGVWSDESRTVRAASTIQVEGAMDAIAAWFIAHLSPGTTISNSPMRIDAIDREQALLPLNRAVDVRIGDEIEILFRLSPVSSSVSWKVALRRDQELILEESHSTLMGTLLTSEDLAIRGSDAVPTMGPWGKARLSVMSWADGTRPIREIERLCAEAYPTLLKSVVDVQTFVREVLEVANR